MKAKRQPGHYWIQEKLYTPYPERKAYPAQGTIGYWDGTFWMLISSECTFSDEHLFAIDEHLLCSPFRPAAAAPGSQVDQGTAAPGNKNDKTT